MKTLLETRILCAGLLSVVALSGCGSSHKNSGTDAGPGGGDVDAARTGEDAGEITGQDAGMSVSEDGGSVGTDAGVALPDAGPPQPCSAPGTLETVSCDAMCGTTQRFCTSSGFWEYGACNRPTDAECAAGTRMALPCGMCGTQEALCNESCHYVRTGTCSGEHGECNSGSMDRTTMGCAAGSTRARTCDATCTWGGFGECVARPTDFDGDGSAYGADCDDHDPAVQAGSTRACGTFVCADGAAPGGYAMRPGSQMCTAGAWTACVRPAACPELTGTTGCDVPRAESRPCAGCGGNESRSCLPGGPGGLTWATWSGCGPAMPPPAVCVAAAEPIAVSCGACNEGVRYTFCTNGCNETESACIGAGCTPGSIVRETAGCPDGQVRTRTCSASCTLGTPSECTPGHPSYPNYTKTAITAACVTLTAAAETLTAVSGDDTMTAARTMPIPFELFGEAVTQYMVSSNGWLSFAPYTDMMSAFTNVSLPDMNRPNGLVAPFWDDLDPRAMPTGINGDVKVEVVGTGATAKLVVAWNHFRTYTETTTDLNFQVHFYADTGVVEFHYCAMGGGTARTLGSDATIGLENLAGTRAIQHSYNTPMAISSGTGLRFTPSP